MNRRVLSIVAACLLLAILTSSAQAMYHTGMGRFMQRDPNGTALVSAGRMGAASRVGSAGAIAAGGGFIQRDPIRQYADGMNLFQYVRSHPVQATDPSGLVLCAPRCDLLERGMDLERVAIERARRQALAKTACDGYVPLLNSSCLRNGGGTLDDYTSKAYKICQDFMKLYDNSHTVINVANCLVAEEERCQKYECCKDRNSCRLTAHIKCYVQNSFYPWPWYTGEPESGIPEGASDVGWSDLWPDFWDDIFGDWGSIYDDWPDDIPYPVG